MKQKILAIFGYAGSGKNLFCDLFQEELASFTLTSGIFAFADELKKDCNSRIFSKMSPPIDIFSCSREVKESVRHILVEEAEKNRSIDEDYYVKLLAATIEKDKESDYILISDGRYLNELNFVNSLGGYGIYLSAYKRNGLETTFIKAANDTEASNMLAVEANADFYLQWENKECRESARHTVKNFIKYLQNHNLF